MADKKKMSNTTSASVNWHQQPWQQEKLFSTQNWMAISHIFSTMSVKKKTRDKNNNEENVKRECLCAWNKDIQNDIYERNLSSRSRQPSA